jgi:glutathione S-transferase
MAARYTLVIGDKNFSSWSLRPWVAMKVAAIPFAETLVRLYQPGTAAAIYPYSGAGKVPVLVIEEDGARGAVWDSLAICETLAERHPEARLWPEDAPARAHARSIAAEMHSGFADVRRQLSMDIAARHPLPALDDATQGQLARILAIWTEALAKAPRGGFLFGPFTIADAFYAPVVTRFITYNVPLTPVTAAYCERVRALPAMREWEDAARAEARRAG